MSAEELDDVLFRTLGEARELRFVEWAGAKVGKCHENASVYALEHPGTRIVRGWLVQCACVGGAIFAAHSVIQEAGDDLIDVTPGERLEMNSGRRFIPHPGDEVSFWEHAQIGQRIVT